LGKNQLMKEVYLELKLECIHLNYRSQILMHMKLMMSLLGHNFHCHQINIHMGKRLV